MNIISTTRSKQASFAAGAIGSCFKYLPQNGVVEAPMHYGSGNTSSQMQLVSSTASLVNLNGGSPARPKVLGVTAPSNMAKTVLGDTGEDGGGSLPCTPELQSYSEVDVSVCPAGDEALENDTRQLLDTFFRGFTGLSHPRWTRDKALSTMKRVVEDVLDKHRYAYNGMINKLGLDDRGDDMSVVSSVAESLFSDGTTNWGRIASLVAFGAVVCQHLKERGMDHCVQLVGQEISSYLLTDQRDWLVKANSWNGFVDFFQVADPESSVRNTLMAFAGFAGIGATLALLIR
ncbi:induced myeloid leukemia cell differentiation protein Mcl-1b [Lampris incognitus]|uniref:induced myeloid leukemia cell differentiation protein Mcl-1b n=1 Tax=Lampris incognitus TaxID=2546036 RepID=UPI0024B5C1E1|nr:induced myeloid leukemia cell differentiation protein Mcl-1b [Lampris incognitus]